MFRTSKLSVWLAPLLLMTGIFFLSAQPNLSSGLGVIDVIARKVVHLGLYALLAALWWRALRTVTSPGVALMAAVAITVGYAVTDELHQTLVPTRSGTVLDVAIDAAGAGLAALYLRGRGGREATPAEHQGSVTGPEPRAKRART